MKITRIEFKQIILEETRKYLEEAALQKAIGTVRSMTVDQLKQFVRTLRWESSPEAEEDREFSYAVADVGKLYSDTGPKKFLDYWVNADDPVRSSNRLPPDTKLIILKGIYPKTFSGSPSKADEIVVKALMHAPAVFIEDLKLAMAKKAKRSATMVSTSIPDYAGPEFIEEISAGAEIGIEKESDMQKKYPYWILLNDDVPVMFPEGYEKEAVNTYNIMMEREGVKEISPRLSELVSGEGNE